jgi:hypothetical protein
MPKSTKDQEKPEREMSTENVFNAAHTKNVAFRAKGGSNEESTQREKMKRNGVEEQDPSISSATSPRVKSAIRQGATYKEQTCCSDDHEMRTKN